MNIIECIDVHKTYALGNSPVHALQGINLNITSGSFMAIAGPSGCGKSTLLNLIACLDNPCRGVVRIEGLETSGMKERQKDQLRLRRLGFVFQSFNLIPVLTVLENVELPLRARKDIAKDEYREIALQALESVGIADQANKRPTNLSGGQRQRVAIARALAGKPSIILADEPTANLDSRTATSVIDLMRTLSTSYGTTFVFSTHDHQLLREVQRVVELHDGQIANERMNS